MRKLTVLIFCIAFTYTSFAYTKGENYIAPTLGYHFFDKKHDLDNAMEFGIRYGRFLSEDYSLEAELGVAPTENDEDNDDYNATSISLNSVMHFDASKTVKPFVFLGLGGFFHDESHAALIAGVGARFTMTENISLDFRLKDMLMTKGRNDIIPSFAINFEFGKSQAAPTVEPVAKEAEKEEPKDSDGDGVLDKDDKCPHTSPVYVQHVNSDGCLPDTDKDGVFDIIDKCPGTPEGIKVNTSGCPYDTDGDGVYDYEDRCPDTLQGVEVNSAGCFKSLTLKINFKNNSDKIESDYNDEIKRFATFLKLNHSLNVEIQGHTDSKGNSDYNKQLSKKRADSVRSELINKYDVNPDRVSAVGYGEELPIAPNDTPENMRKNRRITTVVR